MGARDVGVHRLGVYLGLLLAVIHEDNFGHVGVRLRQVELLRLAVVPAASLLFKKVLLGVVKVTGVGRAFTFFCN